MISDLREGARKDGTDNITLEKGPEISDKGVNLENLDFKIGT